MCILQVFQWKRKRRKILREVVLGTSSQNNRSPKQLVVLGTSSQNNRSPKQLVVWRTASYFLLFTFLYVLETQHQNKVLCSYFAFIPDFILE